MPRACRAKRAISSALGFLPRYVGALRGFAGEGPEWAVGVSHGAAMRVWVAATAGLDPTWLEGRRLDNTLVLTLDGDPDAGWRLLAWGDEPVTHG